MTIEKRWEYMIREIFENTLKFIDSVPKSQRKEIGQFFTEIDTALFMADMIAFKENMLMLDAGAGSGILTAATCMKAVEHGIREIRFDLYENNPLILPLLIQNMEIIRVKAGVKGLNFKYTIIEENFITSNQPKWDEWGDTGIYDGVICNPPYKKITKDSKESVAMIDIVHGQPNIYFLFMAMATKLTKKFGEIVFITPRSFTSGKYFVEFRKWMLNNASIAHMHLFKERNSVFNADSVLQETIIMKLIKQKDFHHTLIVSTSNDRHFTNTEKMIINTSTIVNNQTGQYYILVPTSNKEVELISSLYKWKYTLPKLGFKLSTGKVVDFRVVEHLRLIPGENCYPLLWASNFNNNRIVHPVEASKSSQYIERNKITNVTLMENKDYLLMKRFSSKEESKRIQVAIYEQGDAPSDFLAIENHLNYINGNLSRCEMYGLYVTLNSSHIDNYYRILNGSTQANATEVNSLPMPDIDTIRVLGRNALLDNDLSVEYCDRIIDELLEVGRIGETARR